MKLNLGEFDSLLLNNIVFLNCNIYFSNLYFESIIWTSANSKCSKYFSLRDVVIVALHCFWTGGLKFIRHFKMCFYFYNFFSHEKELYLVSLPLRVCNRLNTNRLPFFIAPGLSWLNAMKRIKCHRSCLLPTYYGCIINIFFMCALLGHEMTSDICWYTKREPKYVHTSKICMWKQVFRVTE